MHALYFCRNESSSIRAFRICSAPSPKFPPPSWNDISSTLQGCDQLTGQVEGGSVGLTLVDSAKEQHAFAGFYKSPLWPPIIHRFPRNGVAATLRGRSMYVGWTLTLSSCRYMWLPMYHKIPVWPTVQPLARHAIAATSRRKSG